MAIESESGLDTPTARLVPGHLVCLPYTRRVYALLELGLFAGGGAQVEQGLDNPDSYRIGNERVVDRPIKNRRRQADYSLHFRFVHNR